jgi:hypothetical protein
MEKELIISQMDKFTKESGTMEKLKDLEYANGQMEKFIKANGLTTGKMEQVSLSGLMGDSTKDLIESIKSMAKAHTYGLMGENTLGSGKMTSAMEKESMLLVKIKVKKAFGKRIKGSNGLMNDKGIHERRVKPFKILT